MSHLNRLNALSTRVSSVNSNISWVRAEQPETPEQWLKLAIEAGSTHKQATTLLCHEYGIPIYDPSLNPTEKSGEKVWSPVGFHNITESRSYFWSLNNEMFEDPERSGLILPSPSWLASKEFSTFNTDVAELHLAMIADERNLNQDVDVDYHNGVISATLGRTRPPLETHRFADIGVDSAKTNRNDANHKLWLSPVQSILKHVGKSTNFNLSFLAGDGATLLESFVQETALRTSNTIIKKDPAKVGPGEVCIIDLDKLSDGSDFKLALMRRAQIIALTSANNISSLLEQIYQHLNYQLLLRHWGQHFIRQVHPKLCPSCRILKNDSPTTLSIELMNLTNSFQSHYLKGEGCSNCFHGYVGTHATCEDSSVPEAFIKILKEVVVDKDDTMSKKAPSPYSIGSKLYGDNFLSMWKSIISSVNEGDIQTDDVKDTLI